MTSSITPMRSMAAPITTMAVVVVGMLAAGILICGSLKLACLEHLQRIFNCPDTADIDHYACLFEHRDGPSAQSPTDHRIYAL